MIGERLIKQFIAACEGARNHLEACMSGRVNFSGGGKSASYPLVMQVLKDAETFLGDPHMTVGQLIKQLLRCDWDALVFVGAKDENAMLGQGMDTNPAIMITENCQAVHDEWMEKCVHITSI